VIGPSGHVGIAGAPQVRLLGTMRENCFVVDDKAQGRLVPSHAELRNPISMSPLLRAQRPKIKATARVQDIVRKGR